ncbi:MAG: HAD family hydrolase [Clostridia bacterium]|nr:HAD family hydrolase [Clostridia bacterium]
MPKTLYVSDLDGTLLKSDQTLSKFTLETVNSLIGQGVLFSYATARSYATSSIVSAGLAENIPVIVYNGTFILENGTDKQLLSNSFEQSDAIRILHTLCDGGIYPIVYSFINSEEKFSYIPHHTTKAFLDTRRGDGRDRPVKVTADLETGDIFHFSCIDEPKKLLPLYEKLKDEFTCVYYLEKYGGKWWLEVQPKAATKANAVLKLKEILGCDRIVCFGDGKNDISMFEVADECYAVANADDELKTLADGIVDKNDNDGVAKWLIDYAIPID